MKEQRHLLKLFRKQFSVLSIAVEDYNDTLSLFKEISEAELDIPNFGTYYADTSEIVVTTDETQISSYDEGNAKIRQMKKCPQFPFLIFYLADGTCTWIYGPCVITLKPSLIQTIDVNAQNEAREARRAAKKAAKANI